MSEEVVGKPKKPIYKKWWFWVIAVLLVGAVISGLGGGSGETATQPAEDAAVTAEQEQPDAEMPAEESAAQEPAAEEPAAAKIGDPLKVGDLVFTVESAKTTKKLKSPLGDKSGYWMVVTVNVKNEGKEPVTIDSSFFKLMESDGTTYETDADNLMYLDSEDNFFLTNINPKLDNTGKILFAIPEEAKDLKLNVQTGAFGTEQGQISLAE